MNYNLYTNNDHSNECGMSLHDSTYSVINSSPKISPASGGGQHHTDYDIVFRNKRCYRDDVNESIPGSVTDDDSNSSSRTVGSSRESSLTVTSGDIDDLKGSKQKNRPLSEAISKEDFGRNIRLRFLQHQQQLKEHRSSADVYMLEDATKNLSRYSTMSPSVSPKQFASNITNHSSNPFISSESIACYPNPQHYNMGSSNYLHLADKSLTNCANYQMMQPFQSQQAAIQRVNYANMCRLGCDQCLTGSPYVPCHPYLMYSPHLATLNNPQYWECDPSSFANPLLFQSHTNLSSFLSAPPQMRQQNGRKVIIS